MPANKSVTHNKTTQYSLPEKARQAIFSKLHSFQILTDIEQQRQNFIARNGHEFGQGEDWPKNRIK